MYHFKCQKLLFRRLTHAKKCKSCYHRYRSSKSNRRQHFRKRKKTQPAKGLSHPVVCVPDALSIIKDDPVVVVKESCVDQVEVPKTDVVSHPERNEKNPMIFRCDKCDYSSFNKRYYTLHVSRAHGGKHFKCQTCGKEFATSTGLRRHLVVHDDAKPYVCELCKFATKYKYSLSVHRCKYLKSKPCKNEKKSYKCDHCDYSSHSKGFVTLHTLRVHGERIFKCEVCELTFKSKQACQRHAIVHNDIHPYVCSKCEFSTKYAASLKDHMMNHAGGKPYKCPQCKFSSAYASNVTKHFRVHSGEKPYKCETCGLRLAWKSQLVRHMEDHIYNLTAAV